MADRSEPIPSDHRILIGGGYGVFGRLLARELSRSLSVETLIAGRDARRARSLAAELGGGASGLRLDLRDLDGVVRAARDCYAVVCCAGPFQCLDRNLPGAVAEAGVHWLDIADSRDWILTTLAEDQPNRRARETGTVVMPGLSTSPTLSGLLARRCRRRLPDATRARATLFTGNRNPKGAAAIASVLESGEPNPISVGLPFGDRPSYHVETADAELWKRELGLAGEFRVAVEWDPGPTALRLIHRTISKLGPTGRRRAARVLGLFGRILDGFGSDLGILQVELWNASGERATAILTGRGQRMAVLPCVVALRSLIGGDLTAHGVIRGWDWLSMDARTQELLQGELELIEEGP